MALYGVDLSNMESGIFELRDNIAVVTLNRPEALNSLNTAIHRDIVACWDEINRNDEIRAGVVTGSGRFFCAGRDIKEFVGTYGAGEAQALRPIDDPDHEMFGVLANHYHVRKPLIGALNGSAVGGGLEVAIMCDMIVMAEDAYIADLHAKINVGGMVSMNTFMPPMIARELTMTDRRFTAQECHMWGFANYVVPKDQVLEKAIEVAEATARMGPDSIQRLKQGSIDLQLASGNIAGPERLEERRRTVRAQMAETAGDHDRMEGMKAFVEKRESQYERPVKAE
ncbi:MAG: enoyl-CoA hydratase/isomerase family protein [Chloroflexi bacterium]|nr:enoyl-CoA hydratase/isomerase family protein [Chloroflexota bacterium]